MKNFSEENKIDQILSNTSGATVRVYAYPAYDMSQYDRADFMISAFGLSPGTATGAVNIFDAAVYSATAATSTALTALSSATASFGATMTSALGLTGANRLVVTFNTAAVASTFSINGVNFTIRATSSPASYEPLGGTGLSNATYASALAVVINSTLATFYSKFEAATETPMGASALSSNAVYIYPKDPGSTTLTATGNYGATANKGILVTGDYQAHIGFPTDKLPNGGRFITIGCKSSALKVPFNVSLIRSKGRYTPSGQGGLAVDVNLGSTS